jgi:hypothetical protein
MRQIPLPKEAQEALLLAPQHSLREEQDTAAAVEHGNRFLQFGGVAPIERHRHPDGMDHVRHQPTQHRPVEEKARHHRKLAARDHLGHPERIKPGSMVADHEHGTPLGEVPQAGAVTVDPVYRQQDDLRDLLEHIAEQDPPRHHNTQSCQPRQKPELGGQGRQPVNADQRQQHEGQGGREHIVGGVGHSHGVAARIGRDRGLVKRP